MVLIQRAEAEADRQHKAMGSVSGHCGRASRADWDGASAALKMCLRQCQITIVDVHHSVSSITNAADPAYPEPLMNNADTED